MPLGQPRVSYPLLTRVPRGGVGDVILCGSRRYIHRPKLGHAPKLIIVLYSNITKEMKKVKDQNFGFENGSGMLLFIANW